MTFKGFNIILVRKYYAYEKTPVQEFTLTYDQFWHRYISDIENDDYVFGTLPEGLTTWLVVGGQTVMFDS